jgi:hypothetical protein
MIVMEYDTVRHRRTQPVSPVPVPVDLDTSAVAHVNPHRQRRSTARVASQDEGAVKPVGSRAECLDAAKHLLTANHRDRRGGTLTRARLTAPDARAQSPGPDGSELALTHRRRGLRREALDGVEVSVEDSTDRAVGARDPAHQLELVRCWRPDRASP